MNNVHNSRLYLLGGISGILGTLSYLAAILVSLDPPSTFAVAMAWPVLSIIFAFSLYRLIGERKQAAANHLAFVFTCLGFTLVAGMLSIQLSVGVGIEEFAAKSATGQREALDLIRRSLRLVDMGLDAAWDLFIGTGLLFLAIALNGDDRFGRWWSIPLAALAAALIALNTLTFPWPPDTRGLFDIGPAIGLFIIAMSVRLVLLSRMMNIPPSGQEHKAGHPPIR